MSLHTWHRQGPHKPSCCATYMLNSHGAEWPQAKKSLASTRIGPLQSCPTLCDHVDHGCQGGGLSRQAYWSVLANTGCHIVLEHHISCCPSLQFP